MAIVGSGIVGTAIAHVLVERGIPVRIFEKGPDFPYPKRIGPEMAQSRQFLDPEGRGRHGGVLLQIPSEPADWAYPSSPKAWRNGSEVLSSLRHRVDTEEIYLHAESAPGPQKYVRLSERRDRYGDPFAHVQYESNQFDRETCRFSDELFDRFKAASGAVDRTPIEVDDFLSGHHHMGTCRMGPGPGDGVVDTLGKVHGLSGLYVVGGSTFCGTSGAVHPTLTMVALALRTARHLAERL